MGRHRWLCLLLWMLFGALGTVRAQQSGAPEAHPFLEEPRTYQILDILVEGATGPTTRDLVLSTSGLYKGMTIRIPGEAVSNAIRQLYRLGMFSDVQVRLERSVGDGAFLVIAVREEPRLEDYEIRGVKRGEREELRKRLVLARGTSVSRSTIGRAQRVIAEYFEKKGHLQVRVTARADSVVGKPGYVRLSFDVDKGPSVEVKRILVEGNRAMSDAWVRRRLKKTKQDAWWRFWGRAKFDPMDLREDLANLIEAYAEQGFRDARVLRDTVYYDSTRAGLVVALSLYEGPRYYVRRIEWRGNTVYTDAQLTEVLGFKPGERYNAKKLQRNLQFNPNGLDVYGLYQNNGYLFFNAQLEERVVAPDSVDLIFELYEGEIATIRRVLITGNTKTKEHVIRRELRTLPGDKFSREAIQRSVRELAVLGFFEPEQIRPDYQVDPERKTVDLTYSVVEKGGDQLELSGSYGGRYIGLILGLRLAFNNFSIQDITRAKAWRPLPSGDGQKLSLSVQVAGRNYQAYSISFTEPWFRGRPMPAGFSLYHNRRTFGLYDYYYYDLYGLPLPPDSLLQQRNEHFHTTGVSLSLGRRLSWPDDFFQLSHALSYQIYDVRLQGSTYYYGLPNGVHQTVSLRQTLSRSSIDNPFFPRTGSEMTLTVDLAPPLPGFIQYHKWRLGLKWNVPIIGNLVLGTALDYGYLGSFRKGERSPFERFYIGGTILEAQQFFGQDIVFMRGYRGGSQLISPRTQDGPIGGTILNKYSAELRYPLVQTQQLNLFPYVFVDAGNTWLDFASYVPTQLYRSAGLGVRLFLPILGLLDLNYGYAFDRIPGVTRPGWVFQFSIGPQF
ncbi:MAG: outer membrane protein assembly factor BamA [Bacteroidetes bacterium]|nr:outer membrane protein assembly factor BamA [Rhodothermia bacterium]MCS7155190.1 outer membrane protein assembly factor BamA [Bacteroidota bacterium]MCX7906183.1 outer membrane protein assembly factor BamA [Bacteroidota bacterium]MDW8138310.1 outer membrane protein assembly factor BamA [Bacteroidota bacterium]MDW8285995.1 outer membrane protein assembly factor BamA [Bacteroidota bacterium]